MRIEMELTKQEVKALKHIKADYESELTRQYIQNPNISVREAQRDDRRIQVINKILGY